MGVRWCVGHIHILSNYTNTLLLTSHSYRIICVLFPAAPVVKCSDKVSAKAGAGNAVISCTVTGNPLPTTATWSWSHDGVQMSAETGKAMDGYEATIQVSSSRCIYGKLSMNPLISFSLHGRRDGGGG